MFILVPSLQSKEIYRFIIDKELDGIMCSMDPNFCKKTKQIVRKKWMGEEKAYFFLSFFFVSFFAFPIER